MPYSLGSLDGDDKDKTAYYIKGESSKLTPFPPYMTKSCSSVQIRKTKLEYGKL
jgi:hypothetical protein